jgi:Aminotransferase class-V
MAKNSSRSVGRHFLQIPGPTSVPDRVLRAMDTPIIDHRGPEFAKLARKCLDGIKTIFKTTSPVIIYTATGTGAWEAALVNTLSAGDKVLMFETGQFASLWKKMAERIGLKPEFISTDWRSQGDRSQAPRGQGQGDQGGLRPAQRDLDRRADPHRRDPQGDRRRGPSGAADGRHHLLARLGRLPA